MKSKWIAPLLLAVLLAGCAEKSSHRPVPPELMATDPTRPAEVTQTTQPTYAPAETAPAASETQPQAAPQQHTPGSREFVRVTDYLDVPYTLPYSTADNFTGKPVYEFSQPFLRYGTVIKLQQVQQELEQGGLSLLIWDAYRPVEAQYALWEAFPDPRYVSDPKKGITSHCRGNTVDVTLVFADGTPVPMPTGFDDFTELADRDYSDCSPEAASYAMLLERTMKEYGFRPYYGEWWHFTDETEYPVEERFTPTAPGRYYAECSEYINLRTLPDVTAPVITTVPAKSEFNVIGRCGEFAMAEYQGLWGYVNADYIRPLEIG